MPTSTDYFAHETACIDPGARIGPGCRIWHFCHIMPEAELGAGCSLGQNVFVGRGVKLGRNAKVQNNVSLYEGVELADDVFLGPSCVFTNVRNPRASVNRRGEYATTRVQQGVTVGANATIVCGVTLGAWCFIGAGAVVTRDTQPYALVLGNPARHKGWMSRHGERLTFDDVGLAACPATGDVYQLKAGEVHFLGQGRPLEE